MTKPGVDAYYLNCPLVQIIAGPGEIEFWIHTEVLTKSSDYFSGLQDKDLLHPDKPIIKPEWDSILFNAYAHWLYSNVVHPSHLDGYDICYPGLSNLCVFAERVDDMRFQHVVLGMLVDRYIGEQEGAEAAEFEMLPDAEDVDDMYRHDRRFPRAKAFR